MIGWGDVHKVVVAMVPLYVALGLGYASIRWWRMFKPDHCDATNRFTCYFIIPFFNFQFTSAINPYSMNYRFFAGDVIAKAIVSIALVSWVKLCRKGNFSWVITSFALSCFNNTLVVGVPLLEAMYGAPGKDLVVQSSVIQALLWFPLLLFMLEFRSALSLTTAEGCNNSNDCNLGQSQVINHSSIEIVVAEQAHNTTTISPVDDKNDQLHEECDKTNDAPKSKRTPIVSSFSSPSPASSSSYSSGSTMKKVLVKLVKNPNCFACVLGLIWALLAKRWSLEMPSIVEGSIMIMAKAGSGVAMFSMGVFMALQEKVIACGVQLSMYGMILRFVVGPLSMAVGSVVLGLKSNVLQISIMQAALPQSILSFIFAQEYGLHANVLSTAVIFGTIISLPLLISYYVVLGIVH